ncbi:MAG: tRNA pseudouridine(38-40) synthase TruA [Bacteroidales bacterium]|nr:tRNA pseudouridine(38-40) synthase TruA [Clostridium sp.]MCM1203754.1 tRNA pseudouridine(38-40) synthase TruA [Bacteroidales bacterium]
MKRIKLTVAYDGTNYCGWQIQKNGITVEEVLNKTLSKFFHEDIVVIGASRTDSGVHAMGNVAVFDADVTMPPEKISYAINNLLPEDIRIQRSEEVPQDFHPRYCDTRKTYEYRIYNAQFPDPMVRLYSHFVYYHLDEEKMQRAADYLVGEHDFRSFCTPKEDVENTVRTIYSIRVIRDGNTVRIRISGNGFLYNMVRIIAGSLMKVGMGMIPPEQVKEILEARDRRKAGHKAAACGLTLMEIEYL